MSLSPGSPWAAFARPSRLDRFRDRPRTLCHGDYRLDNLFFGVRPDHEPIRVVDWQIVSQCVGTYDVGMFLSQSVAPSIRREIELDLLRAYHDRLLEHGVRGYTFADCIDDYRWTLLIGMGSRRRSASQAIDLPSDGGVNLERLFTATFRSSSKPWHIHSLAVSNSGDGTFMSLRRNT